jgi:SPP1 family predicted phage head-tail adaptor
MLAGDRDKRVTIRAATTVSDGRGGETATWSDVSPGWWVSIDPLSAREFLQAGSLQNATTHIVRGLFRDDVTITHRLYWGLERLTFEIIALRKLTTPAHELELECVEVDV